MNLKALSLLTLVCLAGVVIAQAAGVYKFRRPIASSLFSALTGSQLESSTVVSLDTSHSTVIRGKATAPVALLSFVDYACQECTASVRAVERSTKAEYIDTNKVFHVVLQKPAAGGTESWHLARAAVCAANQGRFWDLHEKLFDAGKGAIVGVLSRTTNVNLDVETFRACVEEGISAGRQVAKDVAIAWELKIQSAPAYAIGVADSQGRVTVEKTLTGTDSASSVRAALEAAIQGHRVER